MYGHVVVFVCSHANHVTVSSSKGGAGDDHSRVSLGCGGGGGGEAGYGCFAKVDQPVPAVDIGQGNALGHFLSVGRGVVL